MARTTLFKYNVHEEKISRQRYEMLKQADEKQCSRLSEQRQSLMELQHNFWK